MARPQSMSVVAVLSREELDRVSQNVGCKTRAKSSFWIHLKGSMFGRSSESRGALIDKGQ